MKPAWLISVPAWGERFHKTFAEHTMPSIRAALAKTKGSVRFVIHTDDRQVLAPVMDGFDVEWLGLPDGKNAHYVLGAAHRQIIAAARPGEYVSFLCADMLVSREAFVAAEKRFAEGKRIVMSAATRTLGKTPPVGASSQDLLAWTMANPHPITRDCFWGPGRSSVPWAIYFTRGSTIVLRAFHLHPFAVVMDRAIGFAGATIDFDLADNYDRAEVHVVTDPSEMALAEMSPSERTFPRQASPMSERSIAEWASRHAVDVHRWFFRDNPIVIRGSGDCGEVPVVERIIKQTLENIARR